MFSVIVMVINVILVNQYLRCYAHRAAAWSLR